ncbi:type II secretion system protein GspC [Leclercia sp. LTM01]|uniref:type II secretion system protein GspC n=1 Tax=Leclercia sp. LTM01 TaxID=2870836 RepID=UPI0020747DB2|nr:type II secretion system protein GspC [Leclercia sp. LTM01]MCM5697312.1 type II secretion system protein GspC [Leclercia sp. LTM01]
MISQRIVGLRVNQPFIAQITTMLLLGGLGCQLGVMTWRVGEMVFPPAPPREHNVRPASAPPARVLSTLFVPRQQAERSAVTLSSLNVRLAAVIASSQPENALIVLEQGGQQTSYGINEMISGTQARVQAIYADRVELSNGGHVEALRLDDNADARQPQEPAATRAELAKNPARLLDFVSVSPVNKAGTLQGYRLNPGKEAAIFNRAACSLMTWRLPSTALICVFPSRRQSLWRRQATSRSSALPSCAMMQRKTFL